MIYVLLNKIDWEIQISIQKYLLSVCYVPGTVLDPGDMSEVTPTLKEIYIIEKNTWFMTTTALNPK